MMKVLIAEDDAMSNLMLKKILLRWGFDVETAFDGAEAWRILQERDAPRIAILDWVMPLMEGIEVCRRVRERELNEDCYTYVIMISAKTDKQDIVAAMDVGADDYIVKPFDREEVGARIRAGQRIMEMQEALRVANKRLLFMSRLDSLTGALSRTAVLEDLDLAMYRSLRGKSPLTVSLIDVDNLKGINESYGREAGDHVLQEIVRRINSGLRRADCFGRYGGDEFLVILLGVEFGNSLVVCQRLLKAVRERDFDFGGHSLSVTASQTMAVWDGKMSLEDLVAAVECGLLESRTKGGNRLEFVGKKRSQELPRS